MQALIVTSHPAAESLTQAVARQIEAGIRSVPGQAAERADLAAEGFDPRYTAADHAQFQRRGPTPDDVRAEQRRLDRADMLVLVYPVYWWAMPGLMKGWIDRVFTQGWAYDEKPDGGIEKRLGRLSVQLVALGGADQGTYARHGYDTAMRAQIEHGIFGYCGAPVVGADFLLHTDAAGREQALKRGFAIGAGLQQAVPAT
ncbi:NAD(P)H dehydrogenase [Pseudoroseomonas deserti]|uniref:NAD(P)H dehydrogenase n=1 Tax=Teichococcus deserti TaxID=1817963 RepID=A0A1V2H405_9PROT|nr:NAD(P)H-dependent oxidoreductase [Pseudoroseomonas deserti]ONG54807.1 NAD(P)H dehydrogenase [Pseudoroseomonas deserti]